MTDSDNREKLGAEVREIAHPEWLPIPGAGYYEASHRGQIRSVDRIINGNRHRGVVLKTRLNNSGYKLVNIRNDAGEVWTGTVHGFVLLAHAGRPPSGQEALHGPGGQLDNRYPENLRYGTHEENVADRVAANPKAPPPVRLCILCGAQIATGRRCEDCRAGIGRQAADMLRNGMRLSKVAEELEYPSLDGLHEMARKYGGYGAPPRRRWWHR